MASRALRDLGFLLSALVLGALEFALLLAGWLAIVLLAITPLVVPVLIGFAAAVRWVASVEAWLARRLLGATAEPPPRIPTQGYWRSGLAVLGDRPSRRAQVYLLLRVVAGWPLAVAVVSLVASGFWLAAAPLTYRWTDEPIWNVDSAAESLPLVLVGLAGLALTLLLVRALAAGWRLLADRLLTGARDEARTEPSRRALLVHAVLSVAVSALLLAVWALTGGTYVWPEWPILAVGAVLAVHAWTVLVERRPALWRPTRTFALAAGWCAIVELFLVGVWACAGSGYFWPAWSALGLAAGLVLLWVGTTMRRVERLEETRAGAVDVQEADLRRIERDLHDGAQARLVALGMSLGRAEQKLDADPEAARALVTEARIGVEEALRELRDLARGIRPPVLADRGLGAAVEALADRSPLDVHVVTRIEPRPVPSVETAAYFVVSEALTNAAKHAVADEVDVSLVRRGSTLEVEVRDDGEGGADPSGNGLTGLRRRVEALDGTFTVASPRGGPTVVRAELPCGS